jgi:hypothetical protein
MYTIEIEKSDHEDLFFLRVYEGAEKSNKTFIMSHYDNKENLMIEFEYWLNRAAK